MQVDGVVELLECLDRLEAARLPHLGVGRQTVVSATVNYGGKSVLVVICGKASKDYFFPRQNKLLVTYNHALMFSLKKGLKT